MATASGMAARADNFGLVGNAFAMSAAIFRLFRGDAATRSICAFFGVCHSPPTAGQPPRHGGFRLTIRCGIFTQRWYRLSIFAFSAVAQVADRRIDPVQASQSIALVRRPGGRRRMRMNARDVPI